MLDDLLVICNCRFLEKVMLESEKEKEENEKDVAFYRLPAALRRAKKRQDIQEAGEVLPL